MTSRDLQQESDDENTPITTSDVKKKNERRAPLDPCLGTGLLCLLFYLLCYAAVLIKFTCYAQNYAQE